MATPAMKTHDAKVELIYFNAGGGHRAAAQALSSVMRADPQAWREVVLTNLTEVLDPQGLFRRYTGIDPEDIYNKRLASGFTLGLAQELKLLQGGIRLMHASIVQRLRAHWLASRPDIVVSLIPNFNRALGSSLAQAWPGVPFVTVLTDMADHPPHFWIEPEVAPHVVCGTEHAAAQARAAGIPARRVHRVNGMILRPDFHASPRLTAAERGAARQRIGLPPDKPVGLVLFGGQGSRTMLRVAAKLPDTPLVLMCGRNAALADALQQLPAAAPRVVLGFTPDVARWMELADFFIGKPGPGSISEAVQMGLPVIVTRNAWTMPQERWNATWVRERGVGIVIPSLAALPAAVAAMGAKLADFRAATAREHNRAVFEVPALLERLLREARPSVDQRHLAAA
jgi:UDP-N-acetylglucosamine:LPS N-acetylglucosamine transferase